MRILHILNHIQEIGNGIVNVAVDLACLQAKAGYEVAVASIGGEYETLLEQYGVQHFWLDQRRRPYPLLQAARRYRQIVQQFQPDIVHAHMMTGVVLAKVLRAGTHYGLVSTIHNEFQRSAILMGLADRAIAVSQAVADSMIRRGISADKLRVVRNGTLGSPREPLTDTVSPAPLQRPAITTIAGMYERKGIAELIRAFAQLAPTFPQAHLYLVGNGPDRAKFTAQAKQTAVADRIHFEGFQPQPQRYLESTDIFVLASHREPFGLVLTEARAAGCAIVASHVDGIPEALEEGKAGILVPSGDANQLAAMIAQLLSNTEQLHAWKLRSQENLAWTHVARVWDETLVVYREIHPCNQ